MGLIYPKDLAAWHKWQRSRHPLRRIRDLARRPQTATMTLHTRGTEPAVLFALDATTPTALASVIEPLEYMGDTPVAVIAPHDVADKLPGAWHTQILAETAETPTPLRSTRAVVSAGSFLPIGLATHRWAETLGAQYLVVQHGLLTPYVPPLAPNAHVLTFSERDAQFWASGRTDVTTEPIGSQLLWKAHHTRPAHSTRQTDRAPIFLGQIHGAELDRKISVATAEQFCRETPALYRPHPAETDRLSRAQHARWRRNGISFAPQGTLLETGHPVVSIFSTGVIEAAAAGIPSWVTCVNPPDWVREFWERYELSEWGGSPTAAPAPPPIEPAKAVALRALAATEETP